MRFKSRLVRRLASGTYYIRSILNLGVTVYTPCVALKTVMGLPYWFSIVLISSIAILFTLLVSLYLFSLKLFLVLPDDIVVSNNKYFTYLYFKKIYEQLQNYA